MDRWLVEILRLIKEKDEKEFKLALYKIQQIDKSNIKEADRQYQEALVLKKSMKDIISSLVVKRQTEEKNFSKIWGIDPVYKTKEAQGIVENIENLEDFTLQNLSKNLGVVEAKLEELTKLTSTYNVQKNELWGQIVKDKDENFTYSEYDKWLTSIKSGDDGIPNNKDDVKDVAGYESAFKEYYASQERSNILRSKRQIFEMGMRSQQNTQQDSQYVLSGYLTSAATFSQFDSLYGDLALMKDMDREEDLNDDGVKDYDAMQQSYSAKTGVIGYEYGSLFQAMPKVNNEALQQLTLDYFNKYKVMHQLKEGEAATHFGVQTPPNFMNFMGNVKDSYNFYKTLSEDAQKDHDKLAGKYFGYDPRFMNMEQFYTDVAVNYSNYVNKPLEELGIILPINEADEIKDDKWDEY